MTLAANWIVVIFSLLFVSLGLSAYTYYLRYRFKYDPMSLRRAFKNDATSPYRFGESSNPQISVLAHWAKIVLVGYALSAVATLGFLMILYYCFGHCILCNQPKKVDAPDEGVPTFKKDRRDF